MSDYIKFWAAKELMELWPLLFFAAFFIAIWILALSLAFWDMIFKRFRRTSPQTKPDVSQAIAGRNGGV